MFGPIDPAQLVLDQCVGGRWIRHPQQRFGQTHQRDTLVGAQAIGLQKCIEPTGLAPPRAFDQAGGNSAGLGVDCAGGSGLPDSLLQTSFFIKAIGGAQSRSVDLS